MSARDALVERMAIAIAGLAWVGASSAQRAGWRGNAMDALAIAEPAIREDEREACAVVADHHEQELRAKLSGTRKKRTDFDIGLFESAITEAAAIAESIRARKGPRA